MASFDEFYESLPGDSNKRGEYFEKVFVPWFLKTDPEWSSKITQIWLWDDYPKRWGKDCGIDLVYEDQEGKHWAVQCKCVSPDREISKAEIDSFLSESGDSRIDGRLLIASTDGIGKNAQQVIDRQEKQVVCFLLEHFRHSAVEFPSSPEDLSTGHRQEKRTPRLHQQEAIKNVVEGLQKDDKGQLLMACGTGKTLTALWINEALNAKRTLVLVPSLGLLSQTLREWTATSKEQFNWICVCSDKSVAKQDKTTDNMIEHVSGLGVPVTSDPKDIQRFLLKNDSGIVFSTYQSSPLIVEAQKGLDIPKFDITFADEAHRCAGKVSVAFGCVIDDKKIKSKKRLFMTATPKVLTPSTKAKAEISEVDIASMDDEEQFGTVLHKLSFGDAIDRDLLTDYRIVIVGVDNSMVDSHIKRNNTVAIGDSLSIDAESLAAHIALNKTIDKYSIGRSITFHSKVSDARNFSRNNSIIADTRDQSEVKSRRNIESTYVSGQMSSFKRNEILNRLRRVDTNQTASVVCNARCLGEGVDVPSLDGIAFISPKRSRVDIIQAVGRAIRKSENKTIGTILIPVFIGNEDLISETIELKGYQKIWDILSALKSHDESLENEMDDIAIKLAKNRLSYSDQISLPEKIIFDLPKTELKEFENALRIQIVRNTSDPWLYMYGTLLRYREATGNPYPVQGETFEDELKLIHWVNRQRKYRRSMSKKRFYLLDKLDRWSWGVHESKWDQGISELTQYARQNGHSSPSNTEISLSGFRIGPWVANVRSKKNKISNVQIDTLESLPGWQWSPLKDQWNDNYLKLVDYVNQTGTAQIDGSYKCDDGFSLGKWVKNQRTRKSQGIIDSAHIEKLEDLPGWTWNVLDSVWEHNYGLLVEYLAIHNNRYPNIYFTTEDGVALGNWLTRQRVFFGKMTTNRKALLEKLPRWTWDKKEAMWNESYDELVKYRNETNEAYPVLKYQTKDGYPLGKWVQTQRENYNNGTISKERQSLLESLDGWIWNVMEKEWNDAFNKLSEYMSIHQRRPPQKYMTSDNFKLGQWTNNQIALWKNGSVTPDRIALFELLPNWSWTYGVDRNRERWEIGYKELVKYSVSQGIACPPNKFVTESGFALGSWCASLRDPRKSLSSIQKERLESLPGWCWSVLDAQWLNAYDQLSKYLEDKEVFVIPKDLKTDFNFGLGAWVYRQQKEREILDEWKKKKLEKLSLWQWVMPNLYEYRWKQTYQILKKFANQHGNCDVPDDLSNEQGLPLIRWMKQQGKYLSPEREHLLNQLPGWIKR